MNNGTQDGLLGAGGRKATVILLIIVLMVTGGKSSAEDYLSAVEVSAIGTGAVLINLMGAQARRIEISDRSVIKGPLPEEMALHRFLGGKYYPGKTNFLDNWAGSAVTPVICGLALAGTDFSWPQKHSVQDASQDMFLYISGLLTTKGLTDFSKGLFRRPRPVSFMVDSAMAEMDRSHRWLRTAFFSGHTSSAFFSASFLNLRIRSIMRQRMTPSEYRGWRWASSTTLLGWAGFVGWSRIHAYKHFPSDVAIGAMIGYLIAELFYHWSMTNDSYKKTAASATVFKISFSF
ncbi:MAG: phosphatase PAP2 family protein [FCB group bacterium]|nr:phosphatase PAP2 family protein [FCB group bacterium]